jgi:hypothetical protein
MCIFTDEKHLGDVKNLVLPVDSTLYVLGLNKKEHKTCIQVAKKHRAFNLLEEHGIVMVIIEAGNRLIKVAGAEAIDQFLSMYFAQTPQKPEINLERL